MKYIIEQQSEKHAWGKMKQFGIHSRCGQIGGVQLYVVRNYWEKKDLKEGEISPFEFNEIIREKEGDDFVIVIESSVYSKEEIKEFIKNNFKDFKK